MPPGGVPEIILVDSSSLLPLIYCGHGKLLRSIAGQYGIQFAVVQAVRSEVQRRLQPPSKFAGRQEAFRKAIENGTVLVLDEDAMKARWGCLWETLFCRCNQEGERLYYAGLDRGEAYTYAASLALGLRVVNNDISAIRRLRKEESNIPVPYLRLWDVLLFGLQAGILSIKECDDTRSLLLRLNEGLPVCFKNASVEAGLVGYFCRLVDGSKSRLGSEHPIECFDDLGYLELCPI